MAVSKNNKYLIISPSWLGDLIMSQSLYKTLKKLEPDCVIDIYAPGYTMPILDRMEEIDNKIINFPDMLKMLIHLTGDRIDLFEPILTDTQIKSTVGAYF